VCVSNYLVLFILLTFFLRYDLPVEIILIIVFLGVVLLLAIPLWYNTFFNKERVGVDRLICVKWSENRIQFRGTYFEISIPVEDILSFIVKNERGFGMQIIKVKLRTSQGKIEKIVVGRVGIDKINKLVGFLEQSGVNGEWK
jgi:hypothetical protein